MDERDERPHERLDLRRGEQPEERLNRQIAFIKEIDRAKQVLRQTRLMDNSRRENDAEHSWHLAVMALVLAEHATETIDLNRVVKMLLIHDIVEIDAGDVFAYDTEARRKKEERERVAAGRIFGKLPPEQAEEMKGLWEEFERRESPEAKFAAALDRLQPLLHNYETGGTTWKDHGVTREEVLDLNRHLAEGSPDLWKFARALIDRSHEKGFFPAQNEDPGSSSASPRD